MRLLQRKTPKNAGRVAREIKEEVGCSARILSADETRMVKADGSVAKLLHRGARVNASEASSSRLWIFRATLTCTGKRKDRSAATGFAFLTNILTDTWFDS